MQQGLARPGEFGAQRGHGVPFDGGAAREADAEQLAHGGAGAVAADQVTPAPPRGLGAPGVGGDPVVVLFQGVHTALGDQLDQRVRRGGVAQPARQRVLRHVQGGRVVLEGDPLGVPAAPHGAPGGEVRPFVAQRPTAQPVGHGRRVGVQDDRTGRARFLLAGPFVEHDGGHALAGQGEGKRQPDGSRADDDHRVHDVAPDVRYVITERMQPTGGACVKCPPSGQRSVVRRMSSAAPHRLRTLTDRMSDRGVVRRGLRRQAPAAVFAPGTASSISSAPSTAPVPFFDFRSRPSSWEAKVVRAKFTTM